MMSDRYTSAHFQSNFYKDCYHKILRSLVILSFITLILVCAILYFILFKESPKYFVTTTTGQIIPLTAQGTR